MLYHNQTIISSSITVHSIKENISTFLYHHQAKNLHSFIIKVKWYMGNVAFSNVKNTSTSFCCVGFLRKRKRKFSHRTKHRKIKGSIDDRGHDYLLLLLSYSIKGKK